MVKTVAIIGAGASGLTATKCCLDEGLSPTCFERTTEIGGTWNYKDDDTTDGHASVMQSTIINTSKEIMTFSDFPIPKEFPMFMHNKFVQRYFNLYAERFGIFQHITFNTEVMLIKRSKDFAETGQWEITVKYHDSGEEKTSIFDAVMLCTGHHATRYVPKFEGLDKFKGKVLHSHSYKNSRGYEGKRVLIIGIGNSGGDAAVELSRSASQVYLSTRRGTWVWNRVSRNGDPFDMVFMRRSLVAVRKITPSWLTDLVFKAELNKRFDHRKYSLQPDYSPFAQHVMVNDDIPNRLVAGSIIVKNDVKQFTETGVEFTDGTSEDDIDVVILATGFTFGFPYMEKGLLDVKENKVELYKYVFLPDLQKQTLSVIGCIQPLGAVNPISEIQCRAAVKVFKNESKLPSRGNMWNDIHRKQEDMARKYVKTQRHTIEVEFIQSLDEMAEIVGCKPDLRQLFMSDLRLFFHCFFGPCTPYQYRIMGPGKWSGAKDAILTQWDRTFFPLNTRKLDTNVKSFSDYLLVAVLILVIFAILIKLFLV